VTWPGKPHAVIFGSHSEYRHFFVDFADAFSYNVMPCPPGAQTVEGGSDGQESEIQESREACNNEGCEVVLEKQPIE
jgi:hypothetical protein